MKSSDLDFLMDVLGFNLAPKYSMKRTCEIHAPLFLLSVTTHLQDIAFGFMRSEKKEKVEVVTSVSSQK